MYKKDFFQHFFPGFPYSCVENEGVKKDKKAKSKKRKRDDKIVDKSCQDQNVAICMLFCRFYDDHAEMKNSVKVLKYLESKYKALSLN